MRLNVQRTNKMNETEINGIKFTVAAVVPLLVFTHPHPHKVTVFVCVVVC